MVLKASSEKRKRTQVFPTPESPIRSSLKSRSYVFFAIGRSGSGSRRRRPQGIGPSHYSQLLARAFSGRRTESVGKGVAREGAGGLRMASPRKPRQRRRPGPRRSAAAPQPLPAAPPGSGESVGTKWPPLPLRAARPGRCTRGRAGSAVRERGRREDSLSRADTARQGAARAAKEDRGPASSAT